MSAKTFKNSHEEYTQLFRLIIVKRKSTTLALNTSYLHGKHDNHSSVKFGKKEHKILFNVWCMAFYLWYIEISLLNRLNETNCDITYKYWIKMKVFVTVRNSNLE